MRSKSMVFLTLSVLPLVFVAGCGGGQGAPAAPTTAAAPTQAKAAPTAAPKTEAKAETKTEAKSEPQAAAKDTKAAPKEPVKIRFFRSIPFDASGAWWYIAQDKGYFAEQGIEATVSTGSGAGTAMAALIGNSVEIANSNADSQINAMAEGAQVVSYWQYVKHEGIFGVLANGSNGIKTIADLKGKKIGMIGPASATYSVAKVLLAQNGLSEKDVEFVSLNCCTAQYSAMLDKKVDAIGTWDSQILQIRFTAESEGKKEFLDQLVYFDGTGFLGDTFVVSKDYFEKNKETLARFQRAYQKGVKYMADNPGDSLVIYTKYAKETDKTFDPNNPLHKALIDTRPPKVVMDGSFDYVAMGKSLDTYFKVGLIKTDPKTLDLPKLFPNDVPDLVKKLP